MKRPHRTNAQMGEMMATLRAQIYSGSSAKEAAHALGLSLSWAYKVLTTMGFRAVLVTEAERAQLLASRMGGQRTEKGQA